MSDCNTYINKGEHNGKVKPEQVLIDPGFQTLTSMVNDYNFGAVPWSGVLRGSDMTYVANSQSGNTGPDFITVINQLLSE